MAFDISFHKQNTSSPSIGLAVGRLGKRVLIEYRTKRGEPRARFLDPSRYTLREGQSIDELPKYQRRVCPGVGKETKARRCQFCDDHAADFVQGSVTGLARNHTKIFNVETGGLYQSDC